MKLLQQPNPRETINLAAELSRYGLSPTEWILKREKNNIYHIENKSEPEFCFKGLTKVSDGKMQWQSITLKSV
jgi:hypothetical protein